MSDSDLLDCLHLHPAKMGAEGIGEERAIRAWRKIRNNSDASKCALIEKSTKAGVEIIGFGVSVLVHRKFAEAEISHPQPGLNARIVESVDAGQSVIANYDEIRHANTEGNLQQIICYTNWSRQRLTPEEITVTRQLLAISYQHIPAGYRLGRVISEVVDYEDLQYVADIRSFSVVSRFENFYAAHPETFWNRERGLVVADLVTLSRDPTSIAAGLFIHRRPIFGFTAAEQNLLEFALDGHDDKQLSKLLLRSLPAIKQRWASIFRRIALIDPHLCPASDKNLRGSQKRHKILAYIKEHPEELRPFDLTHSTS